MTEALVKHAARSLVTAPRMPSFPKCHTGNPFTSDGDIVADCESILPSGRKCGYHVWGTRPDVKKALNLHHKMFHPEQIGVVLLNQARQ